MGPESLGLLEVFFYDSQAMTVELLAAQPRWCHLEQWSGRLRVACDPSELGPCSSADFGRDRFIYTQSIRTANW